MGDREGLLAARNAPNTMHADVNAGDQPIQVMVVEVKNDK